MWAATEPGFTCDVCLDAIFTDSAKTYCTPCGHVFHYDCLLNQQKCPLCRTAFTKAQLTRLYLESRSQSTQAVEAVPNEQLENLRKNTNLKLVQELNEAKEMAKELKAAYSSLSKRHMELKNNLKQANQNCANIEKKMKDTIEQKIGYEFMFYELEQKLKRHEEKLTAAEAQIKAFKNDIEVKKAEVHEARKSSETWCARFQKLKRETELQNVQLELPKVNNVSSRLSKASDNWKTVDDIAHSEDDNDEYHSTFEDEPKGAKVSKLDNPFYSSSTSGNITNSRKRPLQQPENIFASVVSPQAKTSFPRVFFNKPPDISITRVEKNKGPVQFSELEPPETLSSVPLSPTSQPSHPVTKGHSQHRTAKKAGSLHGNLSLDSWLKSSKLQASKK